MENDAQIISTNIYNVFVLKYKFSETEKMTLSKPQVPLQTPLRALPSPVLYVPLPTVSIEEWFKEKSQPSAYITNFLT